MMAIKKEDGVAQVLWYPNTTIPYDSEETVKTTEENQLEILFTAEQGASIDDLEIVKKLVIRDIPPEQAGKEYKVKFSIN